MCYGPTMSLSFFIIGIAAALYITFYSPVLRKNNLHLILLFYALMELLQTFQYFYANYCDNIMNKILTEIAYIFVILQPLMWNLFFYFNSNFIEKKIFISGIILSIIWLTANVFSRVVYNKENALKKDTSVFASDKVCTKKNKYHVYWEWTVANLYDFQANYLMYLMIWFVPALASSQYMTVVLLFFSFLVGLLMSYLLNEAYTVTSAWCYISIPIIIFLIIYKVVYEKKI